MGLGRRTFSPGEVLTASNVMNYLQDQAVMSFAGTAARGSAIGTAVAEGMVSYLQDTNTLQFYDGSAWQTFADDGGLPIANGGTGGTTVAAARTNLGIGLVPIVPTSVVANSGSGSYDSTTGLITATGFSTLKINGVFTSAFRNYRVVIDVQSTTTAADLDGDYLTNGTLSGTQFRRFRIYAYSGGLGYNYNDGVTGFNFCRSNGTFGVASTIDIIAPQVSGIYKRTIANSLEATYQMLSSSINSSTASYDGLYLNITSGTVGDTKVKVYGYN